MTRGFVLGKFLPPHLGHVHLCDFARAYVDDLTILVCSRECEPIPGALRHGWMAEMFPRCRVLHLDRDVPQEPADHPDFWGIWRDIVRHFHPEPVDFVFASEPYGHRLAAEAGARFVPVDPLRLSVPISGTLARGDLLAAWEFLPVPVRAHYARSVCVFGPESTGKTRLAGDLARLFATALVPEYGRIHTEAFGVEVTADDLRRIVHGHAASAWAARRRANRLVVMDTDPVLTTIWADMLLGGRPAELDAVADTADLYLLTDVDVPWIDDGTRYFPDAERRARFFGLCRAELERRNLPHVRLSGTWEERLRTAVAAIGDRLGILPPA